MQGRESVGRGSDGGALAEEVADDLEVATSRRRVDGPRAQATALDLGGEEAALNERTHEGDLARVAGEVDERWSVSRGRRRG